MADQANDNVRVVIIVVNSSEEICCIAIDNKETALEVLR